MKITVVRPTIRPRSIVRPFINCFCFFPIQRGKKSASNFDPEFTKEPCRLSPVDSTVIAAIEPEVFEGFSFTNPEYYITTQ